MERGDPGKQRNPGEPEEGVEKRGELRELGEPGERGKIGEPGERREPGEQGELEK